MRLPCNTVLSSLRSRKPFFKAQMKWKVDQGLLNDHLLADWTCDFFSSSPNYLFLFTALLVEICSRTSFIQKKMFHKNPLWEF